MNQNMPLHSRDRSLPGKTKRRFWAKFRLFSAHFPPIFRLWYPIYPHVYDYAYFRLFFAYFPPVVPHPYYKLKHMLPICRFSAHMFTDFAYFPPIFRLKFRLFSACPVLPGIIVKYFKLLKKFLHNNSTGNENVFVDNEIHFLR